MKIPKSSISIIFVASTIGVITLVVIQLIWMRHSWQLSEEIFNQRVSMALCATIETYKNGELCNDGKCTIAKDAGTLAIQNVNSLPIGLINTPDFRAELDKSLGFYQINLNYNLSLSEIKECKPDVYQTAVSLPSLGGRQAYLRMSFPNKQMFILKNMNIMMLATLAILVFITTPMLFVNWSLMKQKRLLQTSVSFFNNMAHEFRTPLSNIGLAVNMLTKKYHFLKNDQLVEVVKYENKQLLSEVERVLHLARIENGDYTLLKELVPVNSLLQVTIKSLAMPIAERKATVLLEDIPENLQLSGDTQHLTSVFRNLLDNALKYSVGPPVVQISARPDPNGVIVIIQDNGIGIPPDQRSIIFEKFQRVHHGNQHDHKGFGLGLAYVKSIVELHGGWVRVNSEENKGSRFEIFLPSA